LTEIRHLTLNEYTNMNLEKTGIRLQQFFSDSYYLRWVVLICIAVIFTFTLYPSLITIRQTYLLGDIVDRDIKAQKDFFIEDKEATQAKQWLAVEEILTIYDFDTTLSMKLSENIKVAFADIRTIYREADPKKQPTASNAHTRKNEFSEASIFEKHDWTQNHAGTITEKSIHDQVWERKKEFEEKIGIPVSTGAYKILENEKFSYEISYLISRILSEILDNGVVTNKEILLRELDMGIVLKTVDTRSERVERNLKKFYGLDQANTMVRIVGQPLLKDVNYNLRNLIVDFVQRLTQPNITLNRSATEERKKTASDSVKPVLYKIKAGEMLLREGERITEIHLLMLKTIQSEEKKERVLGSSVGATMMILCLIMTTYILSIKDLKQLKPNHNKNLLFLSCILVSCFFFAQIAASLFESLPDSTAFSISVSSLIYAMPLASGAMIICLFLGLEVAIPFALVLAISVAIIFQNQFEIFLYFLLNSTMAAYWIRNCRERKIFIIAGLKLGLLNSFLVASISIYLADFTGLKFPWELSLAFLGGRRISEIKTGLAPLIEFTFGYTTDIKLLELANLDQPVLKRLMIEAPGTYHHSVIVGSMVEAAASEIGANSLLAKVCGYYHDIGKVKKPLYFIENQTDGKNRHDKLAPSMSSLILLSHVKDGVEIAKENKLGQVIIDTIRQHHGTSLIQFFYEKAKQKIGDDTVNIDDFRYPGPRPQTREAGLVMLADAAEAASRSLDNPTLARIQGLVQKLINQMFSDNQLGNCELTLKDLHNIAKSFNNILNGIHHHRVEYPEQQTKPNGKTKKREKNGSSGKEQPKKAPTVNGKNKENSPGHLKRLGLS